MSVIKNGGTESIAATPMAKRLAKEKGIDLAAIVPGGKHGEIVAADVLAAGMPGGTSVRATALARRIAKDRGIDLASVAGTGFKGKIRAADLPDEGGAAVEVVLKEIDEVMERHKMSAMRKVIAKRMLQSHTEIPNVTQNIKVDVTELIRMREQLNEGREKADKVSMNDLMIKAVGNAIGKFERFRMTIEGEEFILHDPIHVAFAVGLPDGLVVPVLRDVDQKDIFTISAEAKALTARAREGKLLPEDMTDGRITISNVGMYGTHSFTPIINQPEASIVGVCGVEDELALLDGQVVVRKKMMICVTYDHRILNGTEVCEFEAYLRDLLEHPIRIIV